MRTKQVVLHAAVQSVTYCESLEARRLLATVNGTVGNDVISIDIVGSNIVISVNGTPNNFSDATNTTIVVNAGDGNDTIRVDGNNDNATTINGGDGDDSVIVGGGDYDLNILSDVRVNGDVGNDTVRADDALDAAGGNGVTFNASTFDKGVGTGLIRLASTTERFILDGSPASETINVLASSAVTLASLNGGLGNDSIVVGNGDYDANILGSVTVNGGSGVDTIHLQDGSDTGNDDYALVDPAFPPGAPTTFSKSSTAVTLTPTAEQFTISAAVAAANSTFDIAGYPGNVLVGAGAGDDIFNIGGGDYDSNLNGVTISGDGGYDQIVLDDSSDLPDASEGFDIFATSIRKGVDAANTLTYSATLESLIIHASGSSDRFDVNSTTPSILIQINAGNGDDTLDAAGAEGFNNDLDDALRNTLLFNGDGGSDLVDLRDDADTADADSYVLSHFAFSKSAVSFGDLGLGTVERYDLTGNGGANNFTFGAFFDGDAVTVGGGTGNDTISHNDFNSQFPFGSVLALSGGAGIDQWVINDGADLDAGVYWMTDSTFRVAGGVDSGLVTEYSLFEAIDFDGGVNASFFDLSSFGTATLAINTGGGNDTLSVGGGDIDSRIASNITVEGGAGSDQINFYDGTDDAGSDTVVLELNNLTKNGRSITSLGFESQTYQGNANDTIIEVKYIAIPTTIHGGDGSEWVRFSQFDQDLDSNIFSNVQVYGGGGSGQDTLGFNDQLDNTNDSYTVTSSTFTKSGGLSFVVNYADIDYLYVNCSSTPNQIYLNSTTLTTDYSLRAGGGDDVMYVASNDGNSNDVISQITLIGEAGTDSLIWDDSAATFGETYSVASYRFIRGAADCIIDTTEHWTVLTGLSADTIDFNSTRSTLTYEIVTGAGSDTVNLGDGVTGTENDIQGTLNINTGTQDDLASVGTGDLDEIRGIVNLSMGESGDLDQIDVNDASDAGVLANEYQITGGSFERIGAGTSFGLLSFTEHERIDFHLNNAGTIVNIDDPIAGHDLQNATVYCNGGVDNILVLNTSSTNFPVRLDSGAGLDFLQVNIGGGAPALVGIVADDAFDQITTTAGGTLSLIGGVTVRAQAAFVTGNGAGILSVGTGTFIRPSSPANLANTVDALERGYNGGAWNGSANGSFSSAYAAFSSVNDAVGYAVIGTGATELNVTSVHGVPVSAGEIVVTYTLAGDTNLDRAVNFDDLLTLSQNYSPTTANKNWRQGNFNYNTPDTAIGAVGFEDLLALAQNYGQSASVAGQEWRASSLRRIWKAALIDGVETT